MMRFSSILFSLVFICCSALSVLNAAESAAKPNILLITVDDMSCDSVGVFGCKLAETTPFIDRLAGDGLRFQHAHVQVGNCMPSRNVMMSGLYPHNNRVEGFYQVPDASHPVLPAILKEHGYFTGIRGKVSHSTPFSPHPAWDIVLAEKERNLTKNVRSYYDSTKEGIAGAQAAQKPFFLLMNLSDPHKPFYAEGKKGETIPDPNVPSRVFTPDEVPIPGFLFDDPVVRKELSHYYSTVRRADDCVGAVMEALTESGEEQNTLILFISDHGMPLPFAKTQVYHHSSRTPLIVRWPGRIAAGTCDKHHMVSAVDLLPTLLEAAGIASPEKLDGSSFAPLLFGNQQTGRDFVVKEYNENAGGARHPMRSIETRKFSYIFNPWSDGKRVFRTATQGTPTYRRMKELAATDETIAARLELFDHRVREEFYDYEKDPDALHNLINDPDYQGEIERFRGLMEKWMADTNDHLLEVFRQRDNEEVVQAYMQRVEQESAERRKNRRGNKQPARKQAKLITLGLPETASASAVVTVEIDHKFPPKLGEQQIHMTLKEGETQKRIERKIVTAKGTGKLSVEFEVPASQAGKSIRFAAFVGPDYDGHLQHLTSGEIPVK